MEWIEKYMTEAEHLIYNQEVDKGLALLDSLLYEEPGYGRLHNHIGWAYFYYTQNVAKATLHLELAIKFDGTWAAPYLHLGTLLYREGNYSKALAILETGITKPGAYKSSFYDVMGQCFEMQMQLRKAIRAYRQAVLASTATHECTAFSESIRRCRKKRIALMFTL